MLSAYEESLKNFWDLNNCLGSAERNGFEKGEAIGLEKGALQKNIENARKMKSKGFSVGDIADITGLSVDDIEKL